METEEKKQETAIAQPQENVAQTQSNSQEDDTPEKINWRKFREAREKERKEKVEIEKRADEKEREVAALKAAMEAIVNKPAVNQYQNEDQEETEDQRIKRLVSESIEERIHKDQIERDRQEQQEFPKRLERDYKDFNHVCTTENLDYLEYHYPEVADVFKELPDGYNKWAKVYNAVKKFVPNLDAKKDQAKAEKNLLRPQSMSASGKTTTGDSAPMSLDDKRKTDNWLRMQKIMRGGA